ncbi:MAG: alpha/beta hydrolase [Myxococcales bacterium]
MVMAAAPFGFARASNPALRPLPGPLSLRHPLLVAERVGLDVVRGVARLVGLSAPVQAFLSRNNVQIIKDVPYLGSGDSSHTLDVVRPRDADHRAGLPVVLYVHGGGFETCSKETHWMMAGQFARAGYVVFNINYRLAPEHPFPAGLEDVCSAYLWVLDNAERFGGDHSRIVVAGESAGGNLVTSLAMATCVERPEPWARAVFRRHRVPVAVLAACGFFEVSNAGRFRALAKRSWFVTKQAIEQIGRSYLPKPAHYAGEHDLADPLRLLESSEAFARPLPPFLVTCGTADPLLHDSERLEVALRARGVDHRAHYYPGEIHAFHAMWWRASSKLLWEDTRSFLGELLAPRAAPGDFASPFDAELLAISQELASSAA